MAALLSSSPIGINLDQEAHYMELIIEKRKENQFIQQCNGIGLTYSELVEIWSGIFDNDSDGANKLQILLSNNITENYDQNTSYQVLIEIYKYINSIYCEDRYNKIFHFDSYVNIFIKKVCTNQFLSKYDGYKLLSNRVSKKLIDNGKMIIVKEIHQFLDNHQEIDKSFQLTPAEKNYLIKTDQLPLINGIRFGSQSPTSIRID